MAETLEQNWQRRGALALLLYPLSLVFASLALLRRLLYGIGVFASETMPVPVIVIGNITVGGSGKTPLAIALIEALRTAGYTPGLVSRGYGGTYAQNKTDPAHVANFDARCYGDEAVLIARHTHASIVVGRKRAEAARLLLNIDPDIDVILCDDGLQHYGLRRTVEIAVFDERGIGNGWRLPAGPLRESLTRLARVDAIVLNGVSVDTNRGLPQQLAHAAPAVPLYRMQLIGTNAYRLNVPEQQAPLSSFAGRSILAVAGIGNPQRFFRLLEAAQLAGIHTLPLPDHFDFQNNPFAKSQAEIILITEKDAVKCSGIIDARIWVVPVSAEVDPALIQMLVDRLQYAKTSHFNKPR